MIREHECARCKFFRRKAEGTYGRGTSSCYCAGRVVRGDDPNARRWTYADQDGVLRDSLSAHERRFCPDYEPKVMSDADLKELRDGRGKV